MDEEELIAWQEALDQIAAGRPGEASCPHCGHRPLVIEESDGATKISCSKCGKFIHGRFSPY